MLAFRADVNLGWSLFTGEWCTLKCFMEKGVVIRRDAIPPERIQKILVGGNAVSN